MKQSWICHGGKISRTAAVAVNPYNPARTEAETTGATFQINSTKLYVAVVTLSINDNIRFLENIKQGFIKEEILGTNTSFRSKTIWIRLYDLFKM